MNVQRKIIYQQRQQVLDGEDLQKNVQSMMRFYVDTYVASAFGRAAAPARTATAFCETDEPLREHVLRRRASAVATDEAAAGRSRADDRAERGLLTQAPTPRGEEQYGARRHARA